MFVGCLQDPIGKDGMKFFIDSANALEIQSALAMGASGITTNPSSFAKEYPGANVANFVDHVDAFIVLVPVGAPVSIQPPVNTAKQLELVGCSIAQRPHRLNVLIKVPATIVGMTACKALVKHGIKTNVTLVFNVAQAMLAADVGATIVSAFVARSDDKSPGSGRDLIYMIRNEFDRHGCRDTKLLAASLRESKHVMQAINAGADICTMGLPLMTALLNEPQTNVGLEDFLKPWK